MPDPTKAPYHLLPWEILTPFTKRFMPEVFDGIARVLDFGASKYGYHTFQPLSKAVVLDHLSAYYRHMTRWNFRDLRDHESGLGHYHHASARLIILAMVAHHALRMHPKMEFKVSCDNAARHPLRQTVYGDWTCSHTDKQFFVSKMQDHYSNAIELFNDAYNVLHGALGLLEDHASMSIYNLHSVAETSKPSKGQDE